MNKEDAAPRSKLSGRPLWDALEAVARRHLQLGNEYVLSAVDLLPHNQGSEGWASATVTMSEKLVRANGRPVYVAGRKTTVTAAEVTAFTEEV